MPSNETVLACLKNPKKILFQETTGFMEKMARSQVNNISSKHPSHTQIWEDFLINIALHSPTKHLNLMCNTSYFVQYEAGCLAIFHRRKSSRERLAMRDICYLRLDRTYHDDPASCDLSEFMVVTNTILGVDVDDNYRIVVFDGSESMKGHAPLKNYLTIPTEEYKDQQIALSMEELGVYDNEMDTTDPRWMTPLGIKVYVYLIRQKLAE
ncbi:hypothetical protein BYT27DRAFT_7262534 [Phlegmacium glaucopus]|nr:hypothetical protein BYT27DRAFT_7262534 [Phlegmacium glaucopus]